MPTPSRRAVLALALTALAVPAAAAALPATATTETVAPAPARVVVADVDSGINPYHQAYYAGAGPYAGRQGPSSVNAAVLEELGIGPAQVITLTRTGDFAEDFAKDAEKWAAVQPGKPYWFAGTNVVGISFDPVEAGRTPILADAGDEHGIGTSSSVLDANPDAIVVMVEGTANADAERWAFTHPAVDVVTTSYGIPGSPPVPTHLTSSYDGAVQRGKLHFGASDNSPALSPPDGTSGPWWSIAVAGFHEGSSQGREALSGNVVDFVSDFTQTLPYCSTCESGEQAVSGTSFATPRSAGIASRVLLEARRTAGHVGGPVVQGDGGSLAVRGEGVALTPWDVRRALEEAAVYPGLADYQPAGVADDLSTVPVLDAAPWLQTGWGLLTADAGAGVVKESLAQLSLPGAGPQSRAKSAESCLFNDAVHDVRKAYWDSVAVGSESFGNTAADPYLRCG